MKLRISFLHKKPDSATSMTPEAAYKALEEILNSYPTESPRALAKRLENELKVTKPGDPYLVQLEGKIGAANKAKLSMRQTALIQLIQIARQSGTEDELTWASRPDWVRWLIEGGRRV